MFGSGAFGRDVPLAIHQKTLCCIACAYVNFSTKILLQAVSSRGGVGAFGIPCPAKPFRVCRGLGMFNPSTCVFESPF